MGPVVHLRQMLEIQVGVDLGGADVGMAQQFLNRAQIAARLQQVRREGMAQHVRMHAARDALCTGMMPHPRLHRAGRQTPALA